MKKTAQLFLNIVVGIAAFLFFLIVLFPLDDVLSHYLATLEDVTKSGPKLSVAVSDIDASLFFESEFKDFHLYQNRSEVFSAPSISLGVSWFSLLAGAPSIHFTAHYPSGEVSGQVSLNLQDSGRGTQVTLKSLELDFDAVRLRDLKFLETVFASKGVPLRLRGEIDGNVYLDLAQDISDAEGEIALKIKNARINEMTLDDVKLPPENKSLMIPRLILGQKGDPVIFSVEIAAGRVNFREFNIPGPDLKIVIKGNLILDKQFRPNRMSIDGAFGFSKKLESQFPQIEFIAGFKQKDGLFPFKLSGSRGQPSLKIGEMELSNMLNLSSIF
ncbi:MAG: type II secretion system protein GspN [Deltaproteobacteria bacterium]|nr:type II secretion system protein GspN [Deltaproteobacteria bacterium]